MLPTLALNIIEEESSVAVLQDAQNDGFGPIRGQHHDARGEKAQAVEPNAVARLVRRPIWSWGCNAAAPIPYPALPPTPQWMGCGLAGKSWGHGYVSEVTEVRDAAHLLTSRAATAEIAKDLVRELAWFDEYLRLGVPTVPLIPPPATSRRLGQRG